MVMSLGLFFFSLHPPCCCRISCDPSEVSEASSGFILVIQSSRRSALPFGAAAVESVLLPGTGRGELA